MALTKQQTSAAIDSLRNIQAIAYAKAGYTSQDIAFLYMYGSTLGSYATEILDKTKCPKEREKLAKAKISELAKIKYPHLKPQPIAAIATAAKSIMYKAKQAITATAPAVTNNFQGASHSILRQAATHRSSPPAEQALARAELTAKHGVTITDSGIVSHSVRGGRALKLQNKSK